MEATRVVVVGGGIAGLAAAHRLLESLGGDVVLIEGRPRLCGKIVTETVDGVVIEGGPDSFLSMKPGGVELCKRLGLDGRLVEPEPQSIESGVCPYIRKEEENLPMC